MVAWLLYRRMIRLRVPSVVSSCIDTVRVPVGTHAHSSRSDKQDITKVMNAVLCRELLEIIPGRAHSTFKRTLYSGVSRGGAQGARAPP